MHLSMFQVLICSWAVVRSRKSSFVCSGVLVFSMVFASKWSVTWASVEVLKISGGESVFSIVSINCKFILPFSSYFDS